MAERAETPTSAAVPARAPRGGPGPAGTPRSAPVATTAPIDGAGPDDPPGGSAEPAEALAALVARLRTELTGVRTAMRNRAVIEQAKGVLVERLGITPDQGFDHLVRLSQRANIKLIEVAAAIVGTTAPDPMGTASDGTAGPDPVDAEYREHLARTRARRPNEAARTPALRRRQPRPPAIEALQAKHQLISARVSAARSYDEMAEAIGTADAAWPAPDLVVLVLLEPDGALRMVGGYGMSPDLRSQWGRIPPDPALPLVVAVRDTDVVWLPDPEIAARRFPALFELPFPNAAYYAAPLVAGGRVVGGIGVSWDAAVTDAETTGRYLTALLSPVARRVVDLQGDDIATAWSHYLPGTAAPGGVGGGQAEVWLPAVLDSLHTPALLLSPVRHEGQVVDFRIEYANGLARRVVAAAGLDAAEATLLAVYPGVGSGTLLPAFTQMLHGGDPIRMADLHVGARSEGIQRSQQLTVHAVRLWDRVLMVFRIHTDADLLHDQLLEAERIAHIGSFSLDLRTNELRCSPQLHRMYHGDARTDAIPTDDLTACIHPDDLVTVQETVDRSIAAGKPLTTEFRGAGRMANRRLRVTAEPVPDNDDAVRLVRGTVQDVTEERAREGRLRLAEEALAAQRRQMESERRAAEALQQALLPTDPELGIAEGVEICGRCRATARTGDVDGDWYDAMPLAGGSATALMLGDVADTGLSSMTIAARLRYAVRAYASLDMAPGDILTAVNSMLWTMEVEHTAMLMVGRYEPGTRELRWAAAGQVAPIRYDGDRRGSVLSGPLGLPLGSAPEVKYHEATVTLDEGDRVLFYTDGMVRADRRRSGALDVLLRAGIESDLGNIEVLVDHITSKLGARPEEDMCAMLVRVTC